MEKFRLNNQVEKVLRGENTMFLNPIDTKFVENALKKQHCNYYVFRLFLDSEKLVIYQNRLEITLFEVMVSVPITHQEILGSLFSHNLSEEVFGDIVISDHYYIVVSNKIKRYLLSNFHQIGRKKITLKETSLEEVSGFTPKFRELNFSVQSPRLDSIISKIIPTSRSISSEIITSGKIILNYQPFRNKNYMLKEQDVFSIRGVGKFKFVKMNYISKTGKYYVSIKKYL